MATLDAPAPRRDEVTGPTLEAPTSRRPGLVGFRIAATGAAGLDWGRLHETWALAGEIDALDHATGGRFILGIGAGWHEGEHDAFGIPLPPIGERFDRYESAVRTIAALFSDAARTAPGVRVDDPTYPLRDATNEPPPLRPGGPPLWLGGQRRRGIALAIRYADGWPMPGNRPGDVAYFVEKRDEIRRALAAAGRDPDDFAFAAQLSCGTTPADRAEALAVARRFVRAGANHVILGVPARVAPDGLADVADEIAEPLHTAVA
jgi:alkanesulfonate monooxygenase SsuD/methylene tetrahydromethanopterin reductase-like flavin-dependent oxidoreductase (luciferase family)